MKFFNIFLALELILIFISNNIIAMNDNLNLNEEQEINFRNKVIVNFFEKKLSKFSELAYNNLPEKTSWEQSNSKVSGTLEDPSYELIYNQDGYVYGKAPSDSKKGNSCFFCEDIPIGYNIYVPQTPKGILVEVYGGGGKLFNPNHEGLKPFHKSLLSSNIVSIKLNLIDRHAHNSLRLGTTPQLIMRKETFEAVQASLHEFCLTLKSNPEKLHVDLKHLGGLPIFLFGHSFGGLVSIRHAELYPDHNSFDGYVSLNGGLSNDMAGWVENRTSAWYLNDVNDCEEIKKITKPILLLHTTTDSNVNFESSNNWAKAARKIFFEKKIRFDVFYTNKINPGEVEGDGHYIPQGGVALNEHVDKICNFMTKLEDLDTLSAQTALTTFQWDLYANKLLRNSSTQERFLSEAFKLYKARPEVMTVESFENDWNEHYKSLFNVIYLFENFIRKKDLKDLSERRKTEIEEVFSDKDRDYFHLSYALWSIRQIAKDKDAIEKTLLDNLPLYLSFMRGNDPDYKYGNFPDKFDEPFLKSLMTDKVVTAFWSAMTNPSKWWSYRARYRLAFPYFLTNPKLLNFVEPRTDKSWWTTTNEDLRNIVSSIIHKQQEEERDEEHQAKSSLEKIILKDKKREEAVRNYT